MTRIPAVDRLDRPDLLAVQDAKLGRLGDRLLDNPFFADRVKAVGGRLDRRRLRDVPPVEKADLLDDQQAAPPYGRRLGVDPADVAMVHTTAGTSGRGQEIYGLTWRDVEAVGYLSAVAFRWAGLHPGEAAAFHIGMSNSSGGNAMSRGIQAVGQTPVLVGHLGFRERLALLASYPVVGMYASPSAINGLHRVAQADGLDLRAVLPRLRFLLTSAEPYPVRWAAAMEAAYGATLFEDYGATQSASSICASTCERGALHTTPDGPARGRMHFFEWSVLVEFVDPDTLEPAEPGQDAEMLLTTLDKEASPLLRFRTRDRVRYLGHEDCPCGRSLAAIVPGGITRFDDLLKIKGMNVWPMDMESALFELGPVAEFSGEVRIGDTGRDELLLAVALHPGADEPALVAAIRATFKARFSLTPQVRVVDAAALPEWHTPEHKARRFRDLRGQDLAREAG